VNVLTDTDVESADAASSSPTRMKQNRPNPFRPETVIAFTIGEPGPVSLRIFDVAGRVIRTLVDEELPPRDYEMVWDGRDQNDRKVGPGMYFYMLDAPGGIRETKRMVLLN